MITYTCFQDIIDHGIDYLGGNPADQTKRDCVRAALEAYRDLCNAFTWSYLYTQGRIITSQAYDSSVVGSTVAYLESSGTYPRQMTITGDTWPAWAANGIVRIGGLAPGDNSGGQYDSVYAGPNTTGPVGYKVDQRISATVITLDPVICPVADIAAGTSFVLYQDTYVLPDDFVAQDQALYESHFSGMHFTHPREWLFENRYIFSSGVPEFFTITGDRKYPGRLVTRMFPWPYQSKSVDFIYKRRPHRLYTQSVTSGTVSATSGSNVVTGVGTAFSPNMVGSTFRLSGNTKPPSSLIMGTNIGVFETVVQSWVSPTSIVLQDDLDATYSGVGYMISDTVDIEPGAMLNAYLRCVEKHIGMARTLKDKPSASKQYDVALSEAKCADSRSFAGRHTVVGGNKLRHQWWRGPIGPDQ